MPPLSFPDTIKAQPHTATVQTATATQGNQIMNLDKQSIDTATEAALECALWIGVRYSPDGDDSRPLDADYGMDDYTNQARARMRTLILHMARGAILELGLNLTNIDAGSFGHDFVLTTNHHGTGYCDRGYGQLGDELTRWANTFGTIEAYVTRLDNLGIES